MTPAGLDRITIVRHANGRKIDWHFRGDDGAMYHGTEGTFSAALDAATVRQQQVNGAKDDDNQ